MGYRITGRDGRPVALVPDVSTAREAVAWCTSRGIGLAMSVFKDEDLSGLDLSGADLSFASWERCILDNCKLGDANLTGAYMSECRMHNTILYGADCLGTEFYGSDMMGADLGFVDLFGASLVNADLLNADLRKAKLWHCDLTGTKNLEEAKGSSLALAMCRIVPDGDIVGYKKVRDGSIVTLKIPEWAARTNGTSRSCRASHAYVLDGEGVSFRDEEFVYRPLSWANAFEYDPSPVDDAPGISFFITREEAEAYEYE